MVFLRLTLTGPPNLRNIICFSLKSDVDTYRHSVGYFGLLAFNYCVLLARWKPRESGPSSRPVTWRPGGHETNRQVWHPLRHALWMIQGSSEDGGCRWELLGCYANAVITWIKCRHFIITESVFMKVWKISLARSCCMVVICRCKIDSCNTHSSKFDAV